MAWIKSGVRQPARTGRYPVRLKSGAFGWINDYLRWDGAQWVTRSGNGTPVNGNLEWWESELVEKAMRAGQKEQEGQNSVQGTG